MRSPLSPHLSPNVDSSDLLFTFAARFFPWRWHTWKNGSARTQLHARFMTLFGAKTARSFDSGRSALTAILRAYAFPANAHVVVQAFSCIVVPNSVRAANLKPIFVDIDATYNIDPDALEELLKKDAQIRAVIVQHTFGIAASMERIVSLCQKYDVVLIEDCAHALGARYKGTLLGTFGAAAIFSFGRDKVLSTVSGGMAIVNDAKIAQRLNEDWEKQPLPNRRWIAQRLQHPLIFFLALQCYYVGSIGKIIIAIASKMRLFPLVLDRAEKQGVAPPSFQLPNVLAAWALRQEKKLNEWNTHRRKIASLYNAAFQNVQSIQVPTLHTTTDDAIYFRYTIEVPDQQKLLKKAKERGILLGDWYTTVLAPKDCSPESVGYRAGSCPTAEKAMRHVVNLPTHRGISDADAQRIAAMIIEEI